MLFLCFSGFIPFAQAIETSMGFPGALGVRIPSYDEKGRLHWELEAAEVEMIGAKKYRAREPRMRMLEQNQAVSRARSSSGIFDLDKGSARGDQRLVVEGHGFQAEGENWEFEEISTAGRSRLVLSSQAKVAFADEVGTLLAGSPSIPKKGYPKDSRKVTADKDNIVENATEFPTSAWAEKFELIDLGEGRHKFLLEGEVCIEMQFTESSDSEIELATIHCMDAVVDLATAQNAQRDALGKVVSIHAKGGVRMKQPGRSCQSNSLLWNAQDGLVTLDGNASVVDDQWGIAEGDRIILRKEDGRAEVVGPQNGRARLSLPALPSFSFPKLSRKSRD